MNTPEIKALVQFIALTIRVKRVQAVKDAAVKKEDFDAAIIFRDEERKLKEALLRMENVIIELANMPPDTMIDCPTCEGTGKVQQTDVDWDPCRRCNGTGRIKADV